MTATIGEKIQAELSGRDATFWLKLAMVVVGGLIAVFVVRRVFVAPIDALAVREACASYGFDLDHPLERVEQVSKSGVFDRVTANCSYGPSEDGERQSFSTTLDEIQPGGFFPASKFLGFFVQLGTLALYARMIGEPLYRKFVSES